MNFLVQFKGDSWASKYKYEFNFSYNEGGQDRNCFPKIKLDEIK